MLPQIQDALGGLDEAIERARSGEMSIHQLWTPVQFAISSIRSVIEATPAVSKAEGAFRQAALDYTGGHSLSATMFRDKAGEERALAAMESALNDYKAALRGARMSEAARILGL